MAFGDCCRDLNDAMSVPGNRFFSVQENGVLYLAVGGSDEIGWFDQAVLYCPFCGTQLQTKDKIALGTSN
jgi:hypothetical protein